MTEEEKVKNLMDLVEQNPIKEVPIKEAIEVLYTTLDMTYHKAEEIKLDAATANFFVSSVLCSFIATMASYKRVEEVRKDIENLFSNNEKIDKKN